MNVGRAIQAALEQQRKADMDRILGERVWVKVGDYVLPAARYETLPVYEPRAFLDL